MTRFPDSYRCDLPARNSAFMPMGEEEVRAARRAIVRHQHVFPFHTGACQLILCHSDQIEARGRKTFRRMTGGIGAQKQNRVPIGYGFGAIRQLLKEAFRIGELSVKPFHHLLAHFIATNSQ